MVSDGHGENHVAIPVPPDKPCYRRFKAEINQLISVIGYPLASRDSMSTLKVVIISEENEKEKDGCPICLDDWIEADVVNEMPCHHRYHGQCIRKWLETCGQCPMCRYSMPMDSDYVIANAWHYGGDFSVHKKDEREMRHRWLRENMSHNLDRYLIMNGFWRYQIVYVDEPNDPLEAQIDRLGLE